MSREFKTMNAIFFPKPVYAQAENDRAEAAFVVREDFQGMGIGGYLLGILEQIAKENAYKGFVANVLTQNAGMIHVFKKRYPHAEISMDAGEVYIVMDFEDASTKAES